MKRLSVWLGERCSGWLEWDEEDRMVFRYGADWLNGVGAIPLSHSLPLQGEPFAGRVVRAFFGGILPEGQPRHRLALLLGISEENVFSLLEHLGGECAGAVSLWPEGEKPPTAGRETTRLLMERELEEILTALPDRPFHVGEEGLRLSLAGAQDKLPVLVRADGRYALPLGRTPSTHILKPEPARFPGLVDNEHYCMHLASRVGLPVPAIAYRQIGEVRYLQVERFDRRIDAEGQVHRLHQEDFCQALSVVSERKYQQEGGPGIRECLHLLREWSTLPVRDIGDWIDRVVFNILIGNADAHGKNFSILYEGGSRRLAPLYDLVCTLAWPGLSARMAMKVGSAKAIRQIQPEHLRQMAMEAGLGWATTRRRMRHLVELVERELVVDKPASRIKPYRDLAMIDTVKGVIAGQCDRLKLL